MKKLKPIQPGETVQMHLPGKDTWSTGICTKVAGPRSYKIKMGNATYRRNRRQLIQIDKHPPAEDLTTFPEGHLASQSNTETEDTSQQGDMQTNQQQLENTSLSPTQPSVTPSP